MRAMAKKIAALASGPFVALIYQLDDFRYPWMLIPRGAPIHPDTILAAQIAPTELDARTQAQAALDYYSQQPDAR